jgi:hypothetical protein
MWKYQIVTLQHPMDEAMQNTLNELGRQGWELVAVTDQPGWVRFFFKRPGV